MDTYDVLDTSFAIVYRITIWFYTRDLHVVIEDHVYIVEEYSHDQN